MLYGSEQRLVRNLFEYYKKNKSSDRVEEE